MIRRAFTLLEMLLATSLTALLLVGLLSIAAAGARDARRMSARSESIAADPVFDLIRRDLAGSSAVNSRDALTLTGHAGLDRETLRPTGRLTRITYRIYPGAGLMREQQYLDDPEHLERWKELVLAGARDMEVFASPATLKVRLELRDGKSIDRAITLK